MRSVPSVEEKQLTKLTKMGRERIVLNKMRIIAIDKLEDAERWLNWASPMEELDYYAEVFNLNEIDAQIIENKLTK
jgi:hypothetical protein